MYYVLSNEFLHLCKNSTLSQFNIFYFLFG